MDLLYTDRPDAFGIVSSDADFTPLVMHLRAKGAAVYGFGAKKTPEPFVNACSRFLYLENLGDRAPTSTPQRQREPASREAAARSRRRRMRRADRAQLKRDCAGSSTLLRNAVAVGARRRRLGARSARSASRSATRPRSTRATTAIAS